MKAIVLAAGTGSRMNWLTKDNPKCLLRLRKKTIIEHQISILKKFNIDRIQIITGFMHEKIENHLSDTCEYYHYPHFLKTNNLYTINSNLNILDDQLIILFSDVLISESSMKKLLDCSSEFCLLIDTSKCDESTMRIKFEENRITDIGSHISPSDGHGNFIGIAKFSKKGVKKLKNKIHNICDGVNFLNDYYTLAISMLAKEKTEINYVDLKGDPWIEIDTEDEYIEALKMNFYE